MGSGGEIRRSIGHDKRRVTEEEIAQFQRVFHENLVFPEERLAQNREQ